MWISVASALLSAGVQIYLAFLKAKSLTDDQAHALLDQCIADVKARPAANLKDL